MKVVITDNTTHNIDLIPREYPSGAIVFVLKNEVDRVETTVSNTHVIINGILTITFAFSFSENDKYQFKITEGTTVIYRGKLIATDQTPQDYKLTNGLYE